MSKTKEKTHKTKLTEAGRKHILLGIFAHGSVRDTERVHLYFGDASFKQSHLDNLLNKGMLKLTGIKKDHYALDEKGLKAVAAYIDMANDPSKLTKPLHDSIDHLSRELERWLCREVELEAELTKEADANVELNEKIDEMRAQLAAAVETGKDLYCVTSGTYQESKQFYVTASSYAEAEANHAAYLSQNKHKNHRQPIKKIARLAEAEFVVMGASQ
jgi:hypothetical protein